MSGRKLIGGPVLLQDWDSEAEEAAAKYWELFLDLLMVAAASAVADGLKENPTMEGIHEFVLLILFFINAWNLYTNITTRFEDGTFLHIAILFIFILGNGVCIVNASLEDATAFAIGALLQRSSILATLLSTYISIPRARVFCAEFAKIIVLEIALLISAIVFPTHSISLLWMAVLVELSLEITLSFNVKREDLIPINIDHINDRCGVLLLVMLGETVISATIDYRQVVSSANILKFATEYYWVLFWALFLVFFYSLLFFAIIPPPEFHAARRSRILGCMLAVTHKLTCTSALAVGACVKMTIEAVVEQEDLSDFAINLMSVSVGCTMILLLMTRMLHYLGVFPRGTEPPYAMTLMNFWWTFIFVAAIFPFLGIILRVKNPVTSIAMYACWIFGVCFIETSITHILHPYIIQKPGHESRPIVRDSSSSIVSYQATP
jgi:low temperature requirement protein LtrA